MGSSKGGDVTVGYWYYLDIHFGLGNGPIEKIIAMKADDRYFYGPRTSLMQTANVSRDPAIDQSKSIFISDPELFGGEEREGGFVGVIDIMMGEDTQLVNPALQASVQEATGYTGAMPAFLGQTTVLFRGIKSADFTGTPWESGDNLRPLLDPIQFITEKKGAGLVRSSFCWSAMNPYFKAPRFLVQDCSSDWYPEKATIVQTINTFPLVTLNQINPIHFIRKILTNKSWAGGLADTVVNDATFTAAADTLYDEGFGIGVRWDGSTSKKQFLQYILDHINASLWVDLRTNEFKIKLIRKDYDENTLIELNPSNCRVMEVGRRGLADTVNEVIVTYTVPETGETDTVSAQDSANIARQGRIVSTEKDYTGVQDAELAAKLAYRDLAVLSRPLDKVSLEVGRIGVDLPPGTPFKLVYPLMGYESIVYRVVRRNLGSIRSGTIVIDAVQDVFDAPTVSINRPQQSQWTSSNLEPEAVDNYKLTEVPYALLLRGTTSEQRADWPVGVGFTQVLAKAPNKDSTLYAVVDTASGESTSSGSFNQYAETQSVVEPDDLSVPLTNMSSFLVLTSPEYAYLGDELILITTIDGDTSTATVERGLFDTVPKQHAANTPIYMLGPSATYSVVDPTEREDGETATYRLISKTSRGWFDYGSASNVSYLHDARYVRPYPPAAVKIANTFFPDQITGDIPVTWSHRDRVAQEDIPVDWFDTGNTGPEANVTYTVNIYDVKTTPTLLHSETGIVGNSFTYAEADENTTHGTVSTVVQVEVLAVRDGYDSFQKFTHTFTRIPTIIEYGDPTAYTFGGNQYVDVTE